jgi:hypothetical protein
VRDRFTDRGRADEAWDNQMRALESTVGRWPTRDFHIPLTGHVSASARTGSKTGKKKGLLGKLITGAAIAAGAVVVAGSCLPPAAPKQQAKQGGEKKCDV